jgi:hypothetical protein
MRRLQLRRILGIALIMISVGVISAPAVRAGADTPQIQCITNAQDMDLDLTGSCPAGSPTIVGFDGASGLSVTSAGAVYTDGIQTQGMNGHPLAAPIVGIAPTTPIGRAPSEGRFCAYWLAASDGGVFSFRRAPFYGSMGGKHLNAPIAAIASTGDNRGYWLAASDGGVFAFGDAGFYGSMVGKHLNAPIVGIASTPDEKGYYLVSSDGGVFAFGDAGFYGAMAGRHLNAPITGIASIPSGYFLAGSDGGVFAFGKAVFSASGVGRFDAPVISISAGLEAVATGGVGKGGQRGRARSGPQQSWGAQITASSGDSLFLWLNIP